MSGIPAPSICPNRIPLNNWLSSQTQCVQLIIFHQTHHFSSKPSFPRRQFISAPGMASLHLQYILELSFFTNFLSPPHHIISSQLVRAFSLKADFCWTISFHSYGYFTTDYHHSVILHLHYHTILVPKPLWLPKSTSLHQHTGTASELLLLQIKPSPTWATLVLSWGCCGSMWLKVVMVKINTVVTSLDVFIQVLLLKTFLSWEITSYSSAWRWFITIDFIWVLTTQTLSLSAVSLWLPLEKETGLFIYIYLAFLFHYLHNLFPKTDTKPGASPINSYIELVSMTIIQEPLIHLNAFNFSLLPPNNLKFTLFTSHSVLHLPSLIPASTDPSPTLSAPPTHRSGVLPLPPPAAPPSAVQLSLTGCLVSWLHSALIAFIPGIT